MVGVLVVVGARVEGLKVPAGGKLVGSADGTNAVGSSDGVAVGTLVGARDGAMLTSLKMPPAVLSA